MQNEPRRLELTSGSSRVPKAAEILADSLRSKILAQGLQPGDSLPSEAELIESSNFSRSTVREALRLLEADGLIVIRRGLKGGIVVRHPDPSALGKSFLIHFATSGARMRDFYTLRLAIEPVAAAEAAQHATDQERKELGRFAAQPLSASDMTRAAQFHEKIALMCRNLVLEILLVSLSEILARHVERIAYAPDESAEVHHAHAEVAAAIVEGDPDRASHAMRQHMLDGRSRLEKLGRLDDLIVPPSAWT